MQIISHRGFWNGKVKFNSIAAFEKSFAAGFGIEFDVRDLDGQLMVAHDLPRQNAGLPTFEELLQLYKSFNKDLPLAINIKADGLQEGIKNLLNQYQISNYFFFDIAVPDAIIYYKKDLKKIYTRQSEFEKTPSFYDIAIGVWMDEFSENWISQEILKTHLGNNKKVAIVSPELHKKTNHLARWQFYKNLPFSSKLAICTDFPDEAQKFFKK